MMTAGCSIRIVDHFSHRSDPRIERTKRHQLIDIIGIAICGVICGADGWTDIEEFGRAKQPWLQQFFALPNGIPSHDTFGRVFARLSPTQFQACFQQWIQAVSQQTAGQIIPIDGKTLRRSYDSASQKAAIHMVSAWASANRLVLGQLTTEAKSNEITAIPELLEILALEGCIVTSDALGCQTTIAQQIIDQGADYVLALKGNHGTMYDKVVTFFDQLHAQEPPEDTPHVKPEDAYYETVDGDHGRVKIRRYCQITDLRWLEERSQWKHLQSVGMVEAERHLGDRVTHEQRYYLSSLPQGVQRFAEAVRGHWGIENSVHWVLDVAFREDDCRIRLGHAPENFAVLRHIALNLLRQDSRCTRSIKTKRLKAGWDDEYLAHLLFQSGE